MSDIDDIISAATGKITSDARDGLEAVQQYYQPLLDAAQDLVEKVDTDLGAETLRADTAVNSLAAETLRADTAVNELAAYKATHPDTPPVVTPPVVTPPVVTPPVVTPPVTPPVTKRSLLGIYNGMASDDATKATFGYYADIASSYYQPGQPGLDIAYETARIKRVTSPLITLTLKSGSTTLTDVANQTPAGVKIIDTYVTALATLSAVDPNVVVRATLDHEFEVKLNSGTITGVTLATYAKALAYFFRTLQSKAPKVLGGYWCGGSDTAKVAQVLTGLVMAGAKPAWISVDPYSTSKHSSTETFTQTMTPVLTWLRANADYKAMGSPPIGISEFGSDTSHGDAAVAAWLTGLRPQLTTLGVVFGVFYNRDSTFATKIDGGSYPKAVSAFSASLASK